MTHYTENTSNYIPVILGLLLASVLLFWWSSKETPKAKVEAPTAKPVVEKKKMPKAPLREFTSDELTAFDGKENRPLYMAIDGVVLDVSPGRNFYGPGGPYEIFSGKDASVGLSTMNLDPTTWAGVTSDKLGDAARDTLHNWLTKLSQKYDVVGSLIDGFNPTTLEQLKARGFGNNSEASTTA